MDAGNKYTRQGSDMMALTDVEESQSRVAVLVSGSVDSLLLTPLLSNVVRANARKGLQIDLFFGLKKAAKGRPPAAADPKIANLLKSFDEVSYGGKLMDFVCQLARGEGASSCRWELEGDEAPPAPAPGARVVMTRTPANTTEGREAVARWRAQSHLWATARGQELSEGQGEDEYDAVLVARSDTYWMAPFLVDIESFQLETLRVSTAPCLDDFGISDRAVVMGRGAADVMLGIYGSWQRGDERLSGTRTAEEVWFRTASQGGLNIVPEPMYAAQSLYTESGLPCFSEATFSHVWEPRLEQCFAEDAGDAPVTDLFTAFSCETRNPTFYELLWPQQAQKLHKMVADIANRNESDSILLMVVDQGEVQMAVDTFASVADQELDMDTASLVVGTSPGVCKALADASGASGYKCLVVVPQQDVRLGVLKHAILTTVAAAGLSRKIVSVSPGVTFTRGLKTLRAASQQRTISFAKNSTSSQACREEPGDLAQTNGGVLYLSDAPEVTDMLLRAWKLMEEGQSVSQQAALAEALRASHSDFGLLSCGVGLGSGARRDRVVDADQPPGVTEQIKQEVQKASESAWVDRFRNEASKQRQAHDSAAAAESKRRGEWRKQNLEWKDMWAQRVRELEVENGFNATEAAEERRRKRVEWRKQKQNQPHKRRVRYLPAEEARKVQAKDDKWEADQAAQKADDEQKADFRREAFRRQVQEAQKIIEATRGARTQGEDDQEMSAA